jgi:plastocyanin
MNRGLVALAVGSAFLLAACQGAEQSGEVGTGPGGPDAVEVVADDTLFVPERLELEAGTRVTVEVTNEGGAGHDFTIDDLDLSTGTIATGDVMTATFTVPRGSTAFRCSLHPGMDGEIVGT